MSKDKGSLQDLEKNFLNQQELKKNEFKDDLGVFPFSSMYTDPWLY